jgi:4-hydroxy-L-threonine phosphate dehydrogenase PdxA
VPGDFGHGERALLKPAVRQRRKTVHQRRAPASADGQCPAKSGTSAQSNACHEAAIRELR